MPQRIEPIVVPTLQLPTPPTRGLTPPTRGMKPPRIREPDINYPRVDLPTTVPQDLTPGKGQNQPAQQEPENNRALPDPKTIIDIPPPPVPSFPVPFTDNARIPVPDAGLLTTTASAAFIATGSALAATTALKPLFDELFKIFKTAFKQLQKKLLKKKVKDYSKMPVQQVALGSLDRFRFDSARPYQGPQYPGKDQRKGSRGGGKPQPE